jgi:hypothetical protein
MEMTWFWFAFLHWTLASVNLCINRATKNLHAHMMMTVWELLRRLQEILQILSVAQAHVRLEKGGASKSKHHWRTPTWMRRLLQSGQLLNPHAKMRRIVALWWISRNFQLCMNYQCGRFNKFLGCTRHVFLEWAVPENQSIVNAYHVAHTRESLVSSFGIGKRLLAFSLRN